MTNIQIFDEATETHAHIDTTGTVLKPWLSMMNYLVDEVRLRLGDDGLYVGATDPANVAMVETTLHADAFNVYETDGSEVGVDIGKMKEAVRRARVSSDDTLSVEVTNNDIRTSVTREYSDDALRFDDSTEVLDPDAIRAHTGLEADQKHEVTVDADAFIDAVDHVTETKEYLRLGSTNGKMLLSRGDGNSHVTFQHADVECEETLYASSYFESLVEMLKKARKHHGVTETTLNWTHDFPIEVEFSSDVSSTYFALAPHIHEENPVGKDGE